MSMKKVLTWVFLCLLLGICPALTAFAVERTDISENISEMTLNDRTWSYGDDRLNVQVIEGENVYAQIVVYYTKSQWHAIRNGSGEAELSYTLPKGVALEALSSSITANTGTKEENIGELHRGNSSELLIHIDSGYAQIMEENDNIEIRMDVFLEFQIGSYNLGDQFTVTSESRGSASARWNNYDVTIRKTNAQGETLLLGDARFELEMLEDGSQSIRNQQHIAMTEHNFESNGTFLMEDEMLVTIKDQPAQLHGMFEPGHIYCLTEVRSPIGYIPESEPTLFAFHRYTDSEKEGTLKRIAELNAQYDDWYEAFNGKVAVFEGGRGNQGALYLKNRKVPPLRIRKMDRSTEQPMPNVPFSLKIRPAEADYTPEQYISCGGQWKIDDQKEWIRWDFQTDQNGIYTFPEGTVPYSDQGAYTLEETVPAGYAGYGAGRTNSASFHFSSDGSISILSGTCEAGTWDQGMELVVWNHKAVNLEIHKVNQSEEVLEGAKFALYGKNKPADFSSVADGTDPAEISSETELTGNTDANSEARTTNDVDSNNETEPKTLDINGQTWYRLSDAITGADGTACFYDLDFQTYYLVEEEAPEGYAILASPYQVTLKEEEAQSGVITIKIVNTVDLVMPDMGSTHIHFDLLPCACVTIGFAGLILTKRRRTL